MLRTKGAVPAGSRASHPAVNQDVGEEMHHCGYCGTRTEPDPTKPAGPNWESAWSCPHCQQTYYLTDEEVEDGEDVPDMDNLGEIEIVDASGSVTGMTQPEKVDIDTATANLKKRLDAIRKDSTVEWDRAGPKQMPEASQADLNHLFGIQPSPYGDDFGSF